MMRKALLAAMMISLPLVTSVAFGSLYTWNEAKRPPISLTEALTKADKLLGDDAANRYCVSVALYGDASREGEVGAWNLYFAAADGSRKLVYIPMQGEASVKLWNGPIDWAEDEGRRDDLADVRKRIEKLFAQQGIQAVFEGNQDRLLITYRTREFQIYPKQEDGSYLEKLETVPGPASDGIWMQLQVVDKPDLKYYSHYEGPYWRSMLGTHYLKQPGKYLAIDVRSGPHVKHEISNKLWQIFGKSTNGW